MDGGTAGLAHVAVLERHMRSIQQNAPAVRINPAQCAMVASSLHNIFYVLSRLPDSSPSPQLLAVFSSADMLIQQMRCEGWEHILRSRFTCSDSFTGLLGRVKKAWQLHSTAAWEREHKNAIRKDEVSNASTYVHLLRGEAHSPSVCTGVGGEEGEESALVHAPGLTEEEVIRGFRRHRFGSWKVPFEALTPPLVGAHDALVTSKNTRLVFDVHTGYRYMGAAVVLHELEDSNGRLLSSATHMAFVQDMASRATWCHPNIVPFIGAFTQKMLTHDCENSLASTRPTPALGVIMGDVTGLTVQSVAEDNPTAPVASYIICPPGNSRDAEVYRSLHELLFIQRRRFTLREAIGITLQVADALQYILMDETQVPCEVAASWVVVSPSNIFLCPISRAGGTRVAVGPERDCPSSCRERECSVCDRGMWSTADGAPSSVNREGEENGEGPERFICLQATGTFAVMYAPPVYVEGGPFSRWRPHPHAANPVSYALTQLFLALISNEPPYRLLERQKDLTAQIFEAAGGVNGDHDSTASGDDAADHVPFVKLSIPIGSVIPEGLPEQLRQLCQRGLLLQHPRSNETGGGLTLEEFRGSLHVMFETAADVPLTLPGQRCYEITGDSPGVSPGNEFSVEMVPYQALLSDYGDLAR